MPQEIKNQKATMEKIKFTTDRNGDYQEFPLVSQPIILPNGTELALRYDKLRDGLVITKLWDGKEITIQAMASNQILVK